MDMERNDDEDPMIDDAQSWGVLLSNLQLYVSQDDHDYPHVKKGHCLFSLPYLIGKLGLHFNAQVSYQLNGQFEHQRPYETSRKLYLGKH